MFCLFYRVQANWQAFACMVHLYIPIKNVCMDVDQWHKIVQACQSGDSAVIVETIDNPPPNTRFNKILKTALQYQQWQIVEQLLPFWDCNKSPNIQEIASGTPVDLTQKFVQRLKQYSDPRTIRKDFVACMQSAVVGDRPAHIQFFIQELQGMGVSDLHDVLFWSVVGQTATPETCALLSTYFEPGARQQAAMFDGCVRSNNFSILDYISPEILDDDVFIGGIVGSVNMGKEEIVSRYLPILTQQQLQSIVRTTVESSFARNCAKQLRVWMRVLPEFAPLGPVIEDLLKCAISCNDLAAVQRLAKNYVPTKCHLPTGHPLSWVVNNLAGSFEPDHSLDILKRLLLCYQPDDELVVHAITVAATRRGSVILEHLDVMRSYTSAVNIDCIVFQTSLLKNNDVVAQHILNVMHDEDFLQAIAQIKQSGTVLEELRIWTTMGPHIQQRVLNLAVGHTDRNVSFKRKM